ncbi:MAG: NAD(P)H-hydrate epimerase [Candidatus Levybacteria bacterium]|nr:NAD(P)H-hydrate epimerase [Candidatus Levybacteria bacterium]
MNSIPTVTIDQMREVDRLMVEEIGVPILMMMENASRNIAVLSRKMLGGSVKNKKIVIVCGKGNNGGDGLGAGRHLINYGARVICLLTTEVNKLRPDAKAQYIILQNMQAHTEAYHGPRCFSLLEEFIDADLLIDALIGYDLKGNPKEPIATFIAKANESEKPILAVDIPSGLNGNTGQPYTPTIKAHATITLALPKVGLLTDSAKQNVGELYVADLSIPKTVYEKIGIEVPIIFEKEEVVRIF